MDNEITNKKILVSVIIPTYKRSDALPRAIDSVLAQEGFDAYEVIIVDDNNNDEYRKLTEERMLNYVNNYEVRYVKHDCNKNGAAARNTGARYSKGELICFLDDDDVFLPNKLKKQVEYMNQHPEFGASYTGRIDNKGNAVTYNKTGDLTEEILTLSFFPTTITLMVRKSIYWKIDGFDESFKRHQDFEFLLRLMEVCELGVIPEPLSQIIGNAGDGDRLNGEKFEKIKKQFLDTFDTKISKIDVLKPGFRKKVYAAHYTDLFTSHIHNKHWFLALKILFSGFEKSGLMFLKQIIAHYQYSFIRRMNTN